MMANIIEVILKAKDQTGGTFSKLDASFKSMTGFSLGAAGAIGLASVAISKAVQYTKEAIAANDKYVTSIVDMARFTGDTTDEMSRLVQVADDMFLSQEALNNAMSIGAKKGLDMSVEGIKKLADEYNSLATVQEKNKLLNDNFGRSGLAMGKLLEQGSAGITKAMGAIADGLVVTKESVKQTFEYKRSIDAVNDSLDSLRYSVAQGTMPAITKLNTRWSDFLEALDESEAVTKLLAAGMWMLEGAIQGLDVVFGGYTTELEHMTEVEADRWMARYQQSIEGVTGATEELNEETLSLQDQYNSITSLAQNFTESEEELLEAETDLADYIKKNPWDNKGIDERKTKIETLKQAQQSMVDTWMLNVYTQMLTADKDLNEADMAFLLQFQIDTGMITEEAGKRAMSYFNHAQKILESNGLIQGSIDSLTGKDLYINTYHNDYYGTSPHTPNAPVYPPSHYENETNNTSVITTPDKLLSGASSTILNNTSSKGFVNYGNVTVNTKQADTYQILEQLMG